MVQVFDIDSKVKEYVNSHHRIPKYLLLDSATHKSLSQGFIPKESTNTGRENAKLSALHANGYTLQILSVETDQKMFEVVG